MLQKINYYQLGLVVVVIAGAILYSVFYHPRVPLDSPTPITQGTLAELLPPGMTILQKAEGDVNGDGIPDAVLSWENTNEDNRYRPRFLVIAKGIGNEKYQIISKRADTLIPIGCSRIDYPDPLVSLSIQNGNIRIHEVQWANAETSTAIDLTFQFDGEKYNLVENMRVFENTRADIYRTTKATPDELKGITVENYFEEINDACAEGMLSVPTSTLPTTFRAPVPDSEPHIAGATIERIAIPNCENCYSDIIKTMDGVPDKGVIAINSELTDDIFSEFADGNFIPKDVRIAENRKKRAVFDTENVLSSYKVNIFYIGKGLIQIWQSYVYDRGMFQGYRTFSIQPDGIKALAEIFDDSTSEMIVRQYYPDWEAWLNEQIKNYTGDPGCVPEKDIAQFVPRLYPYSGDVVWEMRITGPSQACTFEPQIQMAVPVEKILKDLPDYVPAESELWKFKQN